MSNKIVCVQCMRELGLHKQSMDVSLYVCERSECPNYGLYQMGEEIEDKPNYQELIDSCVRERPQHGFTNDEIDTLKASNPIMNMDKFDKGLMGCTGIIVEGVSYVYDCDIRKALKCGYENRDLTIAEWD